ncbi:VOC family protein [Thalassotalea mangrovi]|uniref:VOC family protein n=1 Tax=Thalassotalea mangrovi TaxID=2572245 RepID=A0A4U1B3Q8_9GAMM|nr:VOC family protein [Thalassotalea mangrovi]TKB44400.1 VOC family protein [Thalassotalea mangrovi]
MASISKVGQIAIAVSAIKPALEFYCDALGLTLLFEVPPAMAFVQAGDTRLMLTELQGDAKDHHTSVIYYQVDDIDGYVTLLREKGIEFEREPQLAAKMPDHELWLGFLRDPDGNLLSIMAEKPLE